MTQLGTFTISVVTDYHCCHRECKDQLVQEQQQSSLLREEVSQLKEQMEQMELGNKTRMEEIER